MPSGPFRAFKVCSIKAHLARLTPFSVSKSCVLLTKSLSKTHSVSKTAVLLTIRRTYPDNRPSAVVLVNKSSPVVHKVESKVGDLDRFIGKGGSFACWLSGHTHLDFVGHIRGHRRQRMIIADKSGEKDSYMQEARTRGTVLQDSFNLVTVNTSRSTLYVKRIGCTRDQYGRSKSLFTYNYSTGEVLVNE